MIRSSLSTNWSLQLLPAVPDRYRALAGGTGLRWGECAGLRWDAVDLATRILRVVRVAVEVSGHVTDKPYLKSRAGRRVVPIRAFVVELLTEHQRRYPPAANRLRPTPCGPGSRLTICVAPGRGG